jgi:hypothetical protein
VQMGPSDPSCHAHGANHLATPHLLADAHINALRV